MIIEDSNPLFPLEIFQHIIKDVFDMMFALKYSDLRYYLANEYENLTRFTKLDAKQPWQEWHQTLRSLMLTCNTFNTLCRPYLMRTVEVSMAIPSEIWSPISITQWSPSALKKALQDSDMSPKVLEEVNGLTYHQYWEELGSSSTDISSPPAPLLLCLPSLQSLYIDIPDYQTCYEYEDPPNMFRLHTLLQCYAYGRPEGFYDQDHSQGTGTLSSRYSSWVSPASSLTHLLLSHIENLPLVHLLTSSTLISMQLYFCTAEWKDYVLFSSDDESSLSANGEITLVPSNIESTLASRPKPGFKLRFWKAVGEADVTPYLLQYCTSLEELDITYKGEDSISAADHWQPDVPVQIIQQKLLPERVPLPLSTPFQNIRKIRQEGGLDWAYFSNLAEKAGGNVKLLPNLRELTLDDVTRDDCNEGTEDDSGPERVLLRHVEKLEVLRIIRGNPFAFKFKEALLASSHSLKKLEIGWEIRNYHNFQTDDCESTLCDGLDAIRGDNRIEVLEVVVDFYTIRVDPLSFFADVEDDIGSAAMAADGKVRTCHWTRLATILSSDPTTHFPMLKRVNISVMFERVLGRADSDIDVARKFQQRLDGLLGLDLRGSDPQTNQRGVDVDCRVTVRSENGSGQMRTNRFEVTRKDITQSLSA